MRQVETQQFFKGTRRYGLKKGKLLLAFHNKSKTVLQIRTHCARIYVRFLNSIIIDSNHFLGAKVLDVTAYKKNPTYYFLNFTFCFLDLNILSKNLCSIFQYVNQNAKYPFFKNGGCYDPSEALQSDFQNSFLNFTKNISVSLDALSKL